jgi:long-chain acyl-CoA synthetase
MDMVVNHFETLFELAERRPDQAALVDRSVTLTWSEVADRITRTANALLEFGFPEGSRLGVLGENCADSLVAYAGAFLAGVGAILINLHLTADEVEYLLNDGRATAIWASDDCLDTAITAANRLGVAVLADVGSPNTWQSLVAHARNTPPSVDLPATTDLIYTSGTTGKSKGVEVPNRPAPTVRDRLELMERHHLAGLGPHMVVGPMYHAGPHAAVGLMLIGHPVVVTGRFDAEIVLDSIEKYRIATSVMVPTHLIRLLALPDERRRTADVSSLRSISLTGSPCPIPVKKAMIDWLGPVLREAYGGCESGIISYITSGDWLDHPGSVGRVQPPFRPIVLAEDGAPCPRGRDGVLYFVDETGRGIRYYNDPEKTAAAHLVPGTFTLGDVGHLNDDGYLYVTGRVTDTVISGGVNIYPAECEEILTSHPSVRDVALFGIPDPEMGERLVGLVSLADDSATAEDLIDFCRQSIASYKVPRQLLAVTEIPRSPMGKLDKSSLRTTFLKLPGSGQR